MESSLMTGKCERLSLDIKIDIEEERLRNVRETKILYYNCDCLYIR